MATVALALVAVGVLTIRDVPRAYALADGDDFHLAEMLDAEAVYGAKVRLDRVGDRGLLLILRGVDGAGFPPLPAAPFPKEPVDALRFEWFRGTDGALMCPLPSVSGHEARSVDVEASVVFAKATADGSAPPAALHLTLGDESGTQRFRKSFRFQCLVPTGRTSRMSGALRESTSLSTVPLRLVRCATAKKGEGLGDSTPGVELLASLAP